MGSEDSQVVNAPHSCRVFSVCAGLYALIGGLISLFGWVLDIPRMSDWDNDGICIQPNAALCAALAGAGLLCLVWGRKKFAVACGVVTGLIGGVTLFEIVTGIRVDIHTQMMFERTWGREGVVRPGRMGTPASTSWTMIGTALTLLGVTGYWERARRFVPTMVSLSLIISFLSICGYLYDASVMYSIPQFTAIAFQTATFIFAMSLGIIARVPERFPMTAMLDRRAAGYVARLAVPTLVVVPVVMGWLALYGERVGSFDHAFGTAMLVVVLVVGLCVLLFVCTAIIKKFEAASRANAERADVILSSVTDGVMSFDRDGRLLFTNREAHRMLSGEQTQLLGKHAWELFPEGRSKSGIERAVRERVVTDFEEFNPVVNRWFAHRVFPSEGAGVTIYFQDISERKQAEASLREKDRELSAELIAVRRLHVLSARMMRTSSDQSLLEDILDAAIMLSVADKGMIRLVDESTGRLLVVAHRDFKRGFLERFADVEPDDGSMCSLAIKRRERVIVTDVRTSELFQSEEVRRVVMDADIFATQSTPLFGSNGKVLGVISTQLNRPHQFDDRAIRMLDLLARLTSDYLERREAEQRMRRQMKQV